MPSEGFRRHFYQMQNTLRLPICRHSRADMPSFPRRRESRT
ncbi:hypothetical protein [Neisseria basseii]|nr:hypothetical protein [Neisseria basseii]